MMEVFGYIPDGYTIKGKLKGAKGLYPDVVVTYRPMTRTEVHATSAAVLDESMTPDDQERVAAKAIVDHLLDWSLTWNGKKLTIDIDTVLRVQPTLFQILYAIVMGRVAPDEFIENDEAANTEEAVKN